MEINQLIEDMQKIISAQQEKISSLEKSLDYMAEEIGRDRQRMTAIELATQITVDDGYYSDMEISSILDRYGFQLIPQCSISPGVPDSTLDDQVYQFVNEAFFSTTSTIMEKFGLSRPSAIDVMKRVAAAHSDELVLVKKPVRPRSRCQQWILERASWNPLSA